MTAAAAQMKKFTPLKLTWRQYFRKKFHEALISFLPVVGHIPPKLRLCMGIFYLALVVGIFVALFVVGYTTDKNKVFLSPVTGAIADDNCELIPVENTGKYLATQSGKWQRGKGFVYTEAAFALTLSGYTTDRIRFGEFMTDAVTELKAIGKAAATQDVARNLLYWMGWTHVDPQKAANRLFLNGDPLIVFNRDSAVFSVSNMTHDCTVPSTSQYVSSTGTFSATMDVQKWNADPVCGKIMNPVLLGYDTISRPATFSVAFDVRALSVAMAVNLGAQKFANLVEVAAFRRTITDSLGQAYTLSRYYDPKFPGMDPVGCILSVSPPVCVFRRGLLGAIPFFHHVGANATYPTPCNCTTMGPQIRSNPSHNCNIFRFIAGFIYWNLPAGTGMIELLNKLDIQSIQSMSYKAAFITSTFGRSSTLKSTFASPAQRAQAFQFCTLAGLGPCSMATFSIYDVNSAVYTISPDYLQLAFGSCRDSITPNASSWQALIDEPYADLVQSYEECHYSSREILQNQAGITFGNLQIIAPLIVVLILILVIMRQYMCCMAPHHYYNKAEKDGALDDFALALLMTRDGKMEDYGRHHDFSMQFDISKDKDKAGADANPKSSAPFVAGDDIPARKVAPAPPAAPSPSFMLGGGRAFTAVNARGKRMRASFTSTSIIHNIVVELAMNAKQIATVDNKEAVDFIRPAQAEDFVNKNVELLEEEDPGVVNQVVPFSSAASADVADAANAAKEAFLAFPARTQTESVSNSHNLA